ncbi:phosphatidylserine/phosphatidylglycerophosphate/cardiolipin synthase-like enzyme [Mariniflexile fucanivorans]|uniref:phospholipase D n=1 Tax=Mariniflexile fucanivorans TaxID=264023 RepID=A0A4R1RPL0_9FLAO|nr:phospholipase D-like domain-containing protein [Mariniflexile fucanivorans]TCL67822.1 phosphatidylserine/phosphatidylglycerophosphate/cardiolipin synthase-like enzyme [Mariniflexile fucanivorans]
MNNIINDKGKFKGGYFVLNEDRNNNPWLERDDFFVTLPSQNSIKTEIIELIRNSKASIKLCSFIITDHEIYEEIERVLKNSNVAVFILTQLDDSKFSTSLLSEEEMIENFNQVHLDIVKKLYSNGAHVRATRTAHAKFIISDKEKGLLTSANITTPSLTSNPETGIFISDTKALNHLDRLFDEIFQNGTEYTRFITANLNKQFVVSRRQNISENTKVLEIKSKLKFTFEDYNQSLYDEIVKTIENSSGDVFLSTYNIVGLNSLPEFIGALRSVLKKGFSVYIFSRGMNYRADHLEGCTQLANLGCIIYGDVFNHSKGIITPEQSMIFTANIDGNHGLKNGFEVGVILEDNQNINLKAFIEWQIRTAPYVFTISPHKSNYFDYYTYHCKLKEINPKPLPDDITIKLNKSNSDLVKLIDEIPCYYKVKNNKISQLQIGKYSYEASFDNNILNIGNQIKIRDYNLESYLLKYKNAKITLE